MKRAVLFGGDEGAKQWRYSLEVELNHCYKLSKCPSIFSKDYIEGRIAGVRAVAKDMGFEIHEYEMEERP